MAITSNEWFKIGAVFSAIGALTIFGPWLTIDYYDHYGYIFESYNGFTLFDSGYFFGPAMFIPILISLIFVVLFILFAVVKDRNITKYAGVAFVVIFLLSWGFNIAVIGEYDNYPYFTEVYNSGLAETGSIGISFICIIIAALAASKSRTIDASATNAPSVSLTDPSEDVRFCSNCGRDISSIDGDVKYCPGCGSYIGKEKQKE